MPASQGNVVVRNLRPQSVGVPVPVSTGRRRVLPDRQRRTGTRRTRMSTAGRSRPADDGPGGERVARGGRGRRVLLLAVIAALVVVAVVFVVLYLAGNDASDTNSGLGG